MVAAYGSVMPSMAIISQNNAVDIHDRKFYPIFRGYTMKIHDSANAASDTWLPICKYS